MSINKPILNLNNPDHIFVIAEAGSNWKAGDDEEDLTRAKNLIKSAAECGADAVKFQTFKPETVYVPNAGKSHYLEEKGENRDIFDILRILSMSKEMLKEIAEECKSEQIILMSTPFSVDDAKAVDEYVSLHKVASYELNHIRLLEFLAKTGKPIILSTGASKNEEIEFALNLLKENGVNSVCLMQCTARYPAPIESLNLSAISEMKKKYNIPVGLSDHSIDPILAPILSIGFGATIIEKHFTLNKNFKGPDHSFALEPNELSLMINAIRNAEKAKGKRFKTILKIEEELRNFAVRSVQATKNISEGEILKEKVNIDLLRPGNQKRGAEGRFLFMINGKKSKRKIMSGEGITLDDCEN